MARRGQSSTEAGASGHAGTGAGRWLLTYADLITLLMVFFVVLYAMSRLDLARYQALAGSLHRSFTLNPPAAAGGNGPAAGPEGGPGPATGGLWSTGTETPAEQPAPPSPGTPGGGGPGKELEQLGSEIAAVMAGAGPGEGVAVFYSERGLILSLGAVLFDLGRAEVRPDGGRVLEQLAPYLKKTSNAISVEGYTDDLPINTPLFPSNWELSVRRATSVVHYLVRQQAMDPKRFVAMGYGEFRPLVPNVTETNRAKNRRVDIVLLRTSPQSEELKAIIYTPTTPGRPQPGGGPT